MKPVTYFASGSNSAGEIQGLAAIGMNPGITAPDTYPSGLAAAKDLAGTGIRLFVDSGAFGEVEFGPGGLTVKKPITDKEWNKRLDLYEELASALGAQVYVVAPDRVGSQEETLERLRKYAARMRRIERMGANVIVACQKGRMPQAEFFAVAADAVGIPQDRLVAGIPAKKAAATTAEIVEFARLAKPKRMHLLGLGPKAGKRYDEAVAGVQRVSPATELFCDSVLIKAAVGRSEGKTRAYTAALERATEEMEEAQWSEGVEGDDYTESVVEGADEWMPKSGRKELADLADSMYGPDRTRRASIMASPSSWLRSDEGSNDWATQVLDKLWAAHVKQSTGTWRKRTAVIEAFGKGQKMAKKPVVDEIPDSESFCEVTVAPDHPRVIEARKKMDLYWGESKVRELDLTFFEIIIVNISGGKDSIAMMDRVVELADKQGVRDRVIVVHADLGRCEWKGTKELAARQAAHYGYDLVVVKRARNDLLDQILKERKMWPAIGHAQFCTSDHKTSQVSKVVTKATKAIRVAEGLAPLSAKRQVTVLQCLGLRAQESKRRAERDPIAWREANLLRVEMEWYPIFDWTTEDVWERIRKCGVEYPKAYDLGMERFSCAFCILASKNDLRISAKHNKETLRQYVAVEQKIKHRFRVDMSITRLWNETYPKERIPYPKEWAAKEEGKERKR